MSRPRRPPARPDAVIALYKPYGVLSQFTPDGSAHRPLSELGLPEGVWPVGRLDADSEGLLILSANRSVTSALLEPRRGHPREYWAQVEGSADADALGALCAGVMVQSRRTLPCRALAMADPELPERNPPIRFRKNKPTSWLSLTLTEGKNRQVRKMTAAVDLPTLRLHRARIGALQLGQGPLAGLQLGSFRTLDDAGVRLLLTDPDDPSGSDSSEPSLTEP